MALLPDGPPARFTWRGKRHRVAAPTAPSASMANGGGRGASVDAVRDYFQVEDEAGAALLAVPQGRRHDPATGSMRWHLHGLFA